MSYALIDRPNTLRLFIGIIGLMLAGSLLFYFARERQPSADQLKNITASQEFYVATDGTAAGDGSQARPWDFQTALNHPPTVKPGDTIWLKAGTYLGPFTSKLEGAEAAPIIVRNYQGERVVIDLNRTVNGTRLFRVEGKQTWFWGLELLDSSLERNTTETGSDPRSIPRERSSIAAYGDDIKFINMIIHDLGDGFGLWVQAENTELYGSIAYNNGWNSVDRGHGHGFYVQNLEGTKVIRHNISFNNFGTGGKAFGVQGQTTGFLFDGLIHFNNGSPSALLREVPSYRQPNLLVGGEVHPSDRITLINSFFYEPDYTLGGSQGIGYTAKPNGRAVVQNNYFMGGATSFGLGHYASAEVTDNTFFSRHREAARNSNELLLGINPAEGATPKDFMVDRNTYYDLTRKSGDIYPPFQFTGFKNAYGMAALTWEDWRTKTGLDKQSTYVREAPTQTTMHLQANQYEKGRGHIVVYNWAGQESVTVDLKSIGLADKEEFSIYDVQNLTGDPVYQGSYTGEPVRLPLTHRTVMTPTGMDKAPDHTLPEFSVYLIKPKNFKSHLTARQGNVQDGSKQSPDPAASPQEKPKEKEGDDKAADQTGQRKLKIDYQLRFKNNPGGDDKLTVTFIPADTAKQPIIVRFDKATAGQDLTHSSLDKLPAGSYKAIVKLPYALSQEVSSAVTVGSGGLTLKLDQPFLTLDINNDDIINNIDWSHLLRHWSTDTASVDFNGDGIVNNVDASHLLNQWSIKGKALELDADKIAE